MRTIMQSIAVPIDLVAVLAVRADVHVVPMRRAG
jgi:hypothetical protein